jgi:tetratricopeptide (TPR) repeat protein
MIDKDRTFDLAKNHFLRGVSYMQEERWQEAETEFRKSLEYMPDRVSTLTNLCAALIGQKKFDVAKALVDETLELDSHNPELILNKGVLFSEAGEFEKALDRFKEAINLKSDYAVAWNNLGVALKELNRYLEALDSYERALEINPEYAEAWTHRGNVLRGLKRHEEAIASYNRAIELRPNYAGAHYNKGLLQLQTRNFSEGFKNYLWRWKTDSFPCVHPVAALPHCEPGALGGRLLLWAEQGIGDEIFYSSMLAQALNLFQKITLSADRRLHTIFQRSFPSVEIIDRATTTTVLPDLGQNIHTPIGNLGYIMGLSESDIIDTRKPFLLPDLKRVKKLGINRSVSRKKLICGLSWKSANREFGREKSVMLNEFGPVLAIPHLSFVNLQYGDVGCEIQDAKELWKIDIYEERDLDLYNDIEGLLALLQACDIVVTTSCLTAHLAGSIGKMGCVFVPFQKGKLWYWHINDKFSFWYPSLRVFYQDNPFDWKEPINRAAEWLKNNEKFQREN